MSQQGNCRPNNLEALHALHNLLSKSSALCLRLTIWKELHGCLALQKPLLCRTQLAVPAHDVLRPITVTCTQRRAGCLASTRNITRQCTVSQSGPTPICRVCLSDPVSFAGRNLSFRARRSPILKVSEPPKTTLLCTRTRGGH